MSETIKLIQENTLRHWPQQYFGGMSPQTKGTKPKINIKLKRSCTTKETINKMKRQPTKWEKIFANDIQDKGQYPKYIKNSCHITSKPNKQSDQKNRQNT